MAFDVKSTAYANQVQSIVAFSFPVVKGRKTEKCDGSAWLQKGSRCPVLNSGEDEWVIANHTHLSPDQLNYYKTPEGIVALNEEGIEMAVERRTALFFQQAILCYRMPFTFSARGADGQVGVASNMVFKSAGQTGVKYQREAAHSSTIPTLYATDENGKTFVYLKGGSSYAQHNATIGGAECFNGADELIDGQSSEDGKLREAAVKILNRVAKGLDPIQATRQFLQSFKEQVAETKGDLATDDRRRAVLEKYEELSQQVERSLGEKEVFDRLLGVVIDPQDPREAILREVVYKKRYAIIQLQEVVESRIAQRMAGLPMEARDRSLLEFVLLKEFSETAERRTLEKLFCKTAAVLEADYGLDAQGNRPAALKSFNTRVENVRAKYRSEIAGLMRDMRADFRELYSAELGYRAGVFRDLRTKVNGWTQKDFCGRYWEVTGLKVSQAWVSRMEQMVRGDRKVVYATPLGQRRRIISLEDAKACAHTFRVDPGLFLPSLFTSL